MRSIVRHISPLCRSRRRFSFLLLISLLVFIAFLLFIIDHNNQSIDSLPTKDQSLMIRRRNNNFILNALNSKTNATVVEK